MTVPAASGQIAVARRFGAVPTPPLEGEKIGISRNVRDGVWPVNGLRHPVAGDTSGWYIWAGEHRSNAPDFFVPLHVEHVARWCAIAEPYLALPPGWRFLLAPGHEDVWYDETLLTP